MSQLLDANIIIRYLVADDPQKADKIEKLLKTKTHFWLTDVTVAEIVWVLSSYYRLTPKEISQKLEALLALPNIKAHKKRLAKALNYYRQHRIDWIDAYLIAFSLEKNFGPIISYDRDIDKIKSVKREEP